jgi:antitoxin (DNA-binding transcriptional repressor) of toxin-antitoxin stability system
MRVDLDEVKNRFPHMLDLLALGEEIAITDKGEPIAKLVSIPAIAKQHKAMQFGSAKGQFTVPEDFNDPLPKEIEDLFW